jgi:ADP-ribose pyrophosphatase YjhB (NUDIX family)
MPNGWEPRRGSVDAVLAASTPIAEAEHEWLGGRYRVRLRGYTDDVDLPADFIGSVRVFVRVDDRIVVCRNAEGDANPWPGGRIESGESDVETACREVHEETGWILDPTSLRKLGWLHFEHLLERPVDHEYPHADFFMVVYAGTARERDGGYDCDWTDTEGVEVSSELLTIDEAIAAMSDIDSRVSNAFLDMLRA